MDAVLNFAKRYNGDEDQIWRRSSEPFSHWAIGRGFEGFTENVGVEEIFGVAHFQDCHALLLGQIYRSVRVGVTIRQFEFEIDEQWIAQEREQRQTIGARRSDRSQVQLPPQGSRGGVVPTQGGSDPLHSVHILCRDNDFHALKRSVDETAAVSPHSFACLAHPPPPSCAPCLVTYPDTLRNVKAAQLEP
jgi:hypothetical protein